MFHKMQLYLRIGYIQKLEHHLRETPQPQGGSFLPEKQIVWSTKMPVSITTDKITTRVVLIGLDTGRFRLLPSCYISDTSRLPQFPTVLRVRLQLPSMCGHSGHGEEGDLL